MKDINATLNAAGISPIFLKGTGNLIDGIYEDIGERIIVILISGTESDFLTTAECLRTKNMKSVFRLICHLIR